MGRTPSGLAVACQLRVHSRKTKREKALMSEKKLFPVTVVGSWPRPAYLIQALRKRQSGGTEQEFQAVADRAVIECLEAQEQAGVDIPTDGEQRRDNFYSFVVEKLGGMRLMKVSELMDFMKDRARYEEVLRALDVPAFAIKSQIVVERLTTIGLLIANAGTSSVRDQEP